MPPFIGLHILRGNSHGASSFFVVLHACKGYFDDSGVLREPKIGGKTGKRKGSRTRTEHKFAIIRKSERENQISNQLSVSANTRLGQFYFSGAD
jgi:hypothetical protein